MSFITAIRTAIADKSGAVTVDWVVLTAAVVVLSIGAISALDGGIDSMITTINDQLNFSNVASQAESS
ncbi:MAG: Flp pilus assembly pilin Flp [Paracoccaceae bacterium]|jgi:Flp pilus assembly pilin Flp